VEGGAGAKREGSGKEDDGGGVGWGVVGGDTYGNKAEVGDAVLGR